MKDRDILKTIISSGILDEYQRIDVSLQDMISIALDESSERQGNKNILIHHNSIPAKTMEGIYRNRLKIIEYQSSGKENRKIEVDRLRIAVENILTFCGEHPDSELFTVAFNCPVHSYAIFCGMVNQELHVICLILGKHIPDYAL